ncbi:hypothetical protein MGYG_06155 [Nannizzia gypsea CBS 118893]|uniref:Uncharacterized protein n=1 Tax=Arthroderma gypseum (strain ATCC MYA-4604 / CBS 118893) TaxID=535722 RepID=E4V0M3_ARTGP|nr:hypothetical protein MGYG_06155 [Nannizzia gypsea CBS 118893]EFR03160.1 hypothetical protein MGYG_06155 [Nannizzia gypsea CBS 118893]
MLILSQPSEPPQQQRERTRDSSRGGWGEERPDPKSLEDRPQTFSSDVCKQPTSALFSTISDISAQPGADRNINVEFFYRQRCVKPERFTKYGVLQKE